MFTILMFNPFLKIEFRVNTNEPQYISSEAINRSLASSILSEFFQTSLQLGWYQICFENHGALEREGRVVTNTIDNRGNVTMQYKEVLVDSSDTGYKILTGTPDGVPECNRIGGNTKGLNIATSTISLGMPMNDTSEDVTMIGDKEFSFTIGFHFNKLVLYIKQDWLSLLVKYFVILVLWSSFILLVRSTSRFLLSKEI